MKKNIITTSALIATIAASVPLQAALVSYEPFDYTAGQSLNGQDGADGWGSDWTSTHDAGSQAEFGITTGGLSFTGLSTSGNSTERIFFSSNRAAANRTISSSAQSGLFQNGSTMWFSVLYEDAGSGDDFAFIIGDTAHLATGGDPVLTSSGNAFGFAAIGSAINAVGHVGSTSQSHSGSLAANGGTFLLLGKIEWNTNGTDDEFTLYNVTDTSGDENSHTAIGSHSADFDQSGFSLVSMWDRPSNTGRLDEIRLSTDYNGVFAANAIPEPSSVALLGLGALALTFRRRK